MKITKEQQKELKKIDSSYSQIERLTIKSNLNMKSVLRSIFSFDVINLNVQTILDDFGFEKILFD